jgi:hypothetical protein
MILRCAPARSVRVRAGDKLINAHHLSFQHNCTIHNFNLDNIIILNTSVTSNQLRESFAEPKKQYTVQYLLLIRKPLVNWTNSLLAYPYKYVQ